MATYSAPPRKRQRRFLRSRNGCLTCKQRKLKCDESRPTCQRCVDESRTCLGYGQYDDRSSVSPGKHASQPIQPSFLLTTEQYSVPSIRAAGLLRGVETHPGLSLASTDYDGCQYDNPTPYIATTTVASSLQAINAQTLDSVLSSMWGDVLDSDFGGSNAWGCMDTGQPLSGSTVGAQDQHISAAHVTRSVENSNSAAHSSQSLQARLEALCPSDLHLQGLRHFFDFVAICFHLIPVEANRWRTVFGLLALESDIVHGTVSAVGLISLSSRGQTNLRATAYAQRSKSLRSCQELVKRAAQHRWRRQSTAEETEKVKKDALIVLAVAILVGHLEQFDAGIAQESNQILAAAERIIIEVIKSADESAISLGPGSPFRFLTRIILWWDTFSRTMGEGPAGCPWADYPAKIFAEVQRWEESGVEEDNDEVLDTTQCVTGWPLDLLEGVARTTQLKVEIDQLEPDRASWIRTKLAQKHAVDRCNGLGSDTKLNELLFDARSIETQVRSSRPRSIVQDSTPAAELRFIAFEIQQAGAVVYYARSLCCDMARVAGEIDQVLHFLGPTQPDTDTVSERTASASLVDDKAIERRSGPISSGWNTSCAADGCVLWAYLQASIAAPASQQAMCRSMLQRFTEIFQCGLVPLLLELNEEVWSRRELSGRGDAVPTSLRSWCTLEQIWNDVRSQRRWKQLLLF